MPLSQSDPSLDYPGSWADASVGWPAIRFDTEEEARAAHAACSRDDRVVYGSYVLVDSKVLRLETLDLKIYIESILPPSDVTFRAIVKETRDCLPLMTSEDDLRMAIAKRAWELACKWSNR